MRPTYETDHDRQVERELIDLFIHESSTAKKLPLGGRYTIDFAVYRNTGDLAAVVEVKNRPTWEERYQTVFLSLSKTKELLEFEAIGVPAYFLVRLAEFGVYYWRCRSISGLHIRHGGRRDRDDHADTEPCVHIPVSDLTPLTTQIAA
jgi:hypothetical protein